MNVIVGYLTWQYSVGIPALFRAWFNVQWFLYRIFSVPALLKGFFSPLNRIRENRRKGFDLKDFFEVIAINALMRIVGMVIRFVFLLFALLAQIFGFVIGGIVVSLLLAAPLLAPLSVFFGILYLIT